MSEFNSDLVLFLAETIRQYEHHQKMAKAHLKMIDNSLSNYTLPESWLKDKSTLSFPIKLEEKIFSLLLECDDKGKVVQYNLSELKAMPGLPLEGIEEIEVQQEEPLIEEEEDEDFFYEDEGEEPEFVTMFSPGATYHNFDGLDEKDSIVADPEQ